MFSGLVKVGEVLLDTTALTTITNNTVQEVCYWRDRDRRGRALRTCRTKTKAVEICGRL